MTDDQCLVGESVILWFLTCIQQMEATDKHNDVKLVNRWRQLYARAAAAWRKHPEECETCKLDKINFTEDEPLIRPIYENENNRKNQKEILDEVENETGMMFVETNRDDLNNMDAVAYQPLAYVEVKDRDIEYGQYEDYRVSEKKQIAARNLCRDTEMKARIIVRFKDGIYWADLLKEYPIETWGRKDRDDPYDIEKAICIPWSEMHKINNSKIEP